jgi:DNA-binding response OmpR family regulator
MIDQKNPPLGDPDNTRDYRSGVSPKILVVDDDSSIRRLSALALGQSGYTVDAAEDGAIAWQALNANRYDLMITDNRMPKVTGIELLRKLRAARMAMPVILATGILPAWELAQNPWLLPDATLMKPFSIDELLATVKSVFHAHAVIRRQSVPSKCQ